LDLTVVGDLRGVAGDASIAPTQLNTPGGLSVGATLGSPATPALVGSVRLQRQEQSGHDAQRLEAVPSCVRLGENPHGSLALPCSPKGHRQRRAPTSGRDWLATSALPDIALRPPGAVRRPEKELWTV